MIKQLSYGPVIHAAITLENDIVTGITLRPNTTGSFSFELIGKSSTQFQKIVTDWLVAYAAKKPVQSLPTLAPISFPQFTQHVLDKLCAISFGKTASYQDIAQQINAPRAARAIGQACGRNRYPLFIPCHRVITSNGKLGGFAFGTEVKKRLLEFEK